MSKPRKGRTVARIRTGSFERRLSMTRAGLFAGTRMASHMATNWLSSADQREQRHKAMLSKQAQFLVDELGQLKGSVVKIGQMMALYGEHFLPDEVTEALHTLEDQTSALEWKAVEKVIREELGAERPQQPATSAKRLLWGSGEICRPRSEAFPANGLIVGGEPLGGQGR